MQCLAWQPFVPCDWPYDCVVVLNVFSFRPVALELTMGSLPLCNIVKCGIQVCVADCMTNKSVLLKNDP